MSQDALKQKIHNYWNEASCGTDATQQKKYSKAYFEEIEAWRYKYEPEIFSFAQFTRFRGKKVLEAGIGAGSDFIQWVRAGALAHGVDLTKEAVDNVQHRLKLYGLKAQDVQVADIEHLPYPDNSFDLVYSWGVIHHSSDMEQCFSELVRVAKPGGAIKIMVYNRRSISMLHRYLLYGVLKGKPFQSFSSVLYHNQESLGTKAYTSSEIKKMIQKYPVKLIKLSAPVTTYDLYTFKSGTKAKIINIFSYVLSCLLGWNRAGWYMIIELKKKI